MLLDVSNIDIANSCIVVVIVGCSVDDCSVGSCFVLLLTSFLSGALLTLGSFVETTFLNFSRDLGSPAGAFRFFVLMADVSIGYCVNNLALCSVLSICGLLAIITCLVYGAQTRKCFVVLGL